MEYNVCTWEHTKLAVQVNDGNAPAALPLPISADLEEPALLPGAAQGPSAQGQLAPMDPAPPSNLTPSLAQGGQPYSAAQQVFPCEPSESLSSLVLISQNLTILFFKLLLKRTCSELPCATSGAARFDVSLPIINSSPLVCILQILGITSRAGSTNARSMHMQPQLEQTMLATPQAPVHARPQHGTHSLSGLPSLQEIAAGLAAAGGAM